MASSNEIALLLFRLYDFKMNSTNIDSFAKEPVKLVEFPGLWTDKATMKKNLLQMYEQWWPVVFNQPFHVHWMTFSGTPRQEAVQQLLTSRPHDDAADLQTFCFCRSSIATDFFSTNSWVEPITAKKRF